MHYIFFENLRSLQCCFPETVITVLFRQNQFSLVCIVRFGYVYRVPILEVNYRHIEERIQEAIRQCERRVSRKSLLEDCGFYPLSFSWMYLPTSDFISYGIIR